MQAARRDVSNWRITGIGKDVRTTRGRWISRFYEQKLTSHQAGFRRIFRIFSSLGSDGPKKLQPCERSRTCAMSNESKFALEQLLAAAEEMALEKNKENFVARKQLAAVLRRALGMEEEKVSAPAPIPQLKVPGEYPHWRVKYDSSGNELGRRLVNSLKEWSELSRTEPGFNYCLPIDAPLPQEKVIP
jgi:hypothetical protein